MPTFTIDTDNNITAHAVAPAAQDNLAAFASQKEFSKATAEWPISRLVEVWNGSAGTSGFDKLKPIKKFTDRKAATTRIWAASGTTTRRTTLWVPNPQRGDPSWLFLQLLKG